MILYLRITWTIVGAVAAFVLFIGGLTSLTSNNAAFSPIGGALLVVLAIYLAINCGLLWERNK